VKFKVEVWPKEKHGQFYDGDSYIVLWTYLDGTEVNYNLHFWIGQQSTQDEYGAAAYKTVELDTYLEDKPIQHREVQGYESKLFKTYFDDLRILKGGADSGFKHVEKEAFKPRLMRVQGTKKKIEITEVSCLKANLDSGDVFILDKGTEAHQWNGKKANMNEKFAAAQFMQKLKSERGKLETHVHDEADMRKGDEFYDRNFPKTGDRDMPEEFKFDTVKKLFRVSDATGTTEFKQEAEGKITRGLFDSQDVFIFDACHTVFIFTGKEATATERLSGLTHGDSYLRKKKNPYIHICVVNEKKEDKVPEFAEALDK
jgi:gelsolin